MTTSDLAAHGPVLVFELEPSLGSDRRVGAFGLEVSQVLQVIEPTAVSPVPLAPPVVLGIMNFHGRIVTVVDPSAIIGARGPAAVGPETQVILLRHGQRSTGNVGLRVTRVREIVPAAELEATDVPAGPCGGWVAKHCSRLIRIVEIEPILEGLAREVGVSAAREPRQGVG